MIRRATPQDDASIAEILTDAHATQDWFPQELNGPDDNRRFVHELLLPQCEVRVAEEGGRVVGYAALQGDLLRHLFVHPEAQGRGVGTELLDLAKGERPRGFTLWTHQASEARGFYERRGLVAVEHSDGSGTDERLPDVRYEWRPGDPGSSGR